MLKHAAGNHSDSEVLDKSDAMSTIKTVMSEILTLRADTTTGGTTDKLWALAQAIGLLATVGLIGGFALAPEASLNVLWGVLIPTLPASFLLTAALWRSVCPLATLNMLPDRWAGRRQVSPEGARAAGIVGIVLLLVLVPARRFLFNENGPALAVTVAAVAVLALALGFLYDAKAGFCNAICPVLPVERMYGQYPLITVRNPRCPSCTGCTPLTCHDLAPARSLTHSIGPAAEGRSWVRRPLGVFAAAFPGFVVGYYTATDVPFTQAGSVYMHIALWTAACYALVAVIVVGASLQSKVALPLLAAAAVGLYYWYASPLILEALGTSGGATTPLRVVMLAFVAVWLASAMRRRHAPNGNGLEAI